ncbi:MAG: cell envelope biogenesis protein OmpA [Providencia heimbachae]|nr:cell envelope biogenesis protein OmpA [Providencia heimbachae]
MRKIYGVAMLLCIATLSGCMRNDGLHGYNKESWANNTLKESKVIDNKKALVLFYRIDNQDEIKTINIFVNNEYLTSLENNSVKEIKLCAGENSLTAYKTDVKERYNTKLNVENFFQLEAGKEYPILLTEVDGKIVLEKINKSDLVDIKEKTSIRSHTLSRVEVTDNCL